MHNGRIVKPTGDRSLIEFRSAVDAVRCAIEVPTAMVERNIGVPPEHRIEFRVGILCDVTGIAEPEVNLGLIGGSGTSKNRCSEKGAGGAALRR
ncbi:UNVERIFIED_ORG: class 3 adenylate cyclase [Rhizobium etli]|nr:adenylate/guanylate cyclase domain-containing protein [Rhizobium sp. Kim5]